MKSPFKFRHIEVLKRRLEFLEARILEKGGGDDCGFDKQEASALKSAINALELVFNVHNNTEVLSE